MDQLTQRIIEALLDSGKKNTAAGLYCSELHRAYDVLRYEYTKQYEQIKFMKNRFVIGLLCCSATSAVLGFILGFCF